MESHNSNVSHDTQPQAPTCPSNHTLRRVETIQLTPLKCQFGHPMVKQTISDETMCETCNKFSLPNKPAVFFSCKFCRYDQCLKCSVKQATPTRCNTCHKRIQLDGSCYANEALNHFTCFQCHEKAQRVSKSASMEF